MSRMLRCAVLIYAVAATTIAAPSVPEYRLKAELLERFTRFIDWPAAGNHGGAFVIGVIGRSPFGPYLDQIASKRINGKPVKVRRVTLAEIDHCDILFIARTERSNVPSILARAESRPILTVGDSEGLARAGVAINFYNTGDTVRFEINERALQRAGLRASSKLLKLARLVEPEER